MTCCFVSLHLNESNELQNGWFQPQQQDPNQWNGNYYAYGQGYDAYGYGQPPQDPNMYAYGAYPGYPNYQQQQQQQQQVNYQQQQVRVCSLLTISHC